MVAMEGADGVDALARRSALIGRAGHPSGQPRPPLDPGTRDGTRLRKPAKPTIPVGVVSLMSQWLYRGAFWSHYTYVPVPGAGHGISATAANQAGGRKNPLPVELTTDDD